MAVERFDIVITAKGTTRTAREISRIGKEASSARKSLALMRNALVVFSAARAVTGLVGIADTLTNLRNRLQATLGSFGAATAAQEKLIQIALETRTGLDATADAFARLALGAGDLGVPTEELLNITRSLNQAIILSGTSAQEGKNAMIQLSQGFASGTLRGDELRSVLEQLPLVARLIAKEMGITVGVLRDVGKQGAITSEILRKTFANNKELLGDQFAGTVSTIEQSLSKLSTQFIVLIDRFATASNLFNNIGTSLGGVSSAMGVLAANATTLGIAFNLLLTGGVLVGLKFLLGKIGTIAALSRVFKIFAIRVGPLAGFLATATFAGRKIMRLFRSLGAFMLSPAGIIFAFVNLGLAVKSVTDASDTAERTFKRLQKQTATFEGLKDTDFLNAKTIKKQADNAEATLNQLQAGLKFAQKDTFFLQSLGLTPANIKQLKAQVDRAQVQVDRLRGLQAAREAKEAAAPKIGKNARKLINSIKDDIAELSVTGAERGLLEALNSARIKNATDDEKKAVRALIVDKMRLEELEDKRKDAARELERLARKAIRSAKDLAQSTETMADKIERFKNESEALKPILIANGKTAAQSQDIITKANEEFVRQLEKEEAKKKSAIFGKFLTLREKEIKVTTDLARKFAALDPVTQKAVGGQEALAAATDKATLAIRKQAAANANAIITRFNLNAQIQQQAAEIKKAFKDAGPNNDQLLSGLNQADAIKRTRREILGLGNAATMAAQQIKGLEDFAKEFPGDAEEVANKIREINIALLENQTTASAGAERFLLKYSRDIEDVASKTEDLLGKAFKGAEDAIVEFVSTGKVSFSDLVTSIEKDLIRLAARGVLSELVGGFTGNRPKASFLGSLFGGGAGGGGGGEAVGALGGLFKGLFGAKNGADFTVGSGTSVANIPGEDNRVVAFKAKDGERVTVEPVGGGRDRQINLTMNINTPDANSFRRSQGQILNDAQQSLRRASLRNG